VQALLQAKADVHLRGPHARTALHMACLGGATGALGSVVRLLM
jgi:hypothetical protein